MVNASGEAGHPKGADATDHQPPVRLGSKGMARLPNRPAGGIVSIVWDTPADPVDGYAVRWTTADGASGTYAAPAEATSGTLGELPMGSGPIIIAVVPHRGGRWLAPLGTVVVSWEDEG